MAVCFFGRSASGGRMRQAHLLTHTVPDARLRRGAKSGVGRARPYTGPPRVDSSTML